MSKLKPYEKYNAIQLNFTDKLPLGWKVLRGKFVFKEINERSLDGKEQLLSVSEHKGVVPRDSIIVNMFQAENYTGYKLCNPGDVVINSLWAWHRGIGVSEHRGIISTAYSVHRLRNQEKWNFKYLTYLLRTNAYVGEYLIRSKGIWDSRLQLTGRNFQDIQIIVPPLETQNTIVEYLDRKNQQIENFIAKKERLIELLEEKKKNIISTILDNNGKEIKLKFILKIQNGEGIASELIQDLGEYEVYGGNGVLGYYHKFNNSNETIVIGRVGALCGNVHYSNLKIWVNDNAMCVKTKYLYKYMYYVLKNAKLNLLSFANAQPLITGSSVKNKSVIFEKDTLKQSKIVEKIETNLFKVDSAISKAQLEIEKVKEYQESLITQVVTGQLQVPDKTTRSLEYETKMNLVAESENIYSSNK